MVSGTGRLFRVQFFLLNLILFKNSTEAYLATMTSQHTAGLLWHRKGWIKLSTTLLLAENESMRWSRFWFKRCSGETAVWCIASSWDTGNLFLIEKWCCLADNLRSHDATERNFLLHQKMSSKWFIASDAAWSAARSRKRVSSWFRRKFNLLSPQQEQ